MSKPYAPIEMTASERLIAAMLADISRPAAKRELDYEKIMDALINGRSWVIRQEYQWLFADYEDDADTVLQVARVLDMWRMVESAVASFDAAEKAAFEAQVASHDTDPKYWGYDGNNEDEYGIARHFIEDMGRWKEFQGRSHNSHMTTAPSYNRMEAAFRPLLSQLGGQTLA